MDGVEILALKEIAIEYVYCWRAFGITLGIIFAIYAVVGIVLCVKNYDWSYIPHFALAGLILGLVFGVVTGLAFMEPVEYETQYKVTISSDVSMIEFLDRYEIIDQDGKIFTVREKQEEKSHD